MNKNNYLSSAHILTSNKSAEVALFYIIHSLDGCLVCHLLES